VERDRLTSPASTPQLLLRALFFVLVALAFGLVVLPAIA
jgi:hypothetical protein